MSSFVAFHLETSDFERATGAVESWLRDYGFGRAQPVKVDPSGDFGMWGATRRAVLAKLNDRWLMLRLDGFGLRRNWQIERDELAALAQGAGVRVVFLTVQTTSSCYRFVVHESGALRREIELNDYELATDEGALLAGETANAFQAPEPDSQTAEEWDPFENMQHIAAEMGLTLWESAGEPPFVLWTKRPWYRRLFG